MTENEAIEELKQNVEMPFGSDISKEASKLAIKALKEIQQYRAIGTVEECQDAMETAPEHVEAVKLLTLAAICYVENLGIIKDRMKENREARDLYMRMSVVQHSRNSAALERLAESGIDVDGIRDPEEISRILFPALKVAKFYRDTCAACPNCGKLIERD